MAAVQQDLAPQTTIEQLVAASLRGCGDACTELYLRCKPQVTRVVGRIVGQQHLDDVTQLVFIHVFEVLHRFEGRAKFTTWLHQLATNRALDYRRQLRRRERFMAGGRAIADPVDARAGALEMREAIDAALSQIDPEQRSVVLLRVVEGMSYLEIATQLRVCIGTVRSRLNRARTALRSRLYHL